MNEIRILGSKRVGSGQPLISSYGIPTLVGPICDLPVISKSRIPYLLPNPCMFT